MAVATPQRLQPARRVVEDGQIVQRCAGCGTILGTEDLPPLGRISPGEPLRVKCGCNTWNLVVVGKARGIEPS